MVEYKTCMSEPFTPHPTSLNTNSSPAQQNFSTLLSTTQLHYFKMKFFSNLVNIVPLVVLGAAGVMAQSSDAVISAIEAFTSTSSNLATVVNDLSVVNFGVDGIVCISHPEDSHTVLIVDVRKS